MGIVYLDAATGVSGDMVLAALIDCGADINAINATLRRLNVGALEVSVAETTLSGLRGLKLEVHTDGPRMFRHLGDIEKILESASLPERVRERSRAAFRAIAEAEARVHATTVDKIHFHEVGAFDTLADVVGTMAALESLGVDALYAGVIGVGVGEVECEHGRLPVPAPATAELLAGWPIRVTRIPGELTTPTGAALVTTLARPTSGAEQFQIRRIGCGIGHRHYQEHVTLFRAFLAEELGAGLRDEMVEVAANIDDATPEQLGALFELLPAAGAVDITIAPVTMKKCRPGHELKVLVSPERLEELLRAVFVNTTTLGVRVVPVGRRTLERRIVTVASAFGEVAVKEGRLAGAVVTASPEYESCLAVARAKGVPLAQVMRAAMASYDQGSG